ncbi:MAG: hypothetical protein NTX03_10760 [Bacteroidetes bacterium]|nr:hypothetical protein [Bacteroidota bacterium]
MKLLTLKINPKTLWAILLVLVVFALLYWAHPAMMQTPSRVYFGNSGDGLKNYYTVQYHVLHDTSYLHFGGMNYPFGEHIVFTDGQPVLENTLRFIHKNIVRLSSNDIVGVMNWMMIVSLPLMALFLFFIFMEFEVKGWFAFLACIGITFLAPQFVRFLGHYALSYAYVVPCLWLLLIRFFKNPGYLKSLLIAFLIVFFSFLHFYYLLLLLFLGGGLWAVQFITKKQPLNRKNILNFGLQIIVPFLVVMVFMKLTDTVTDRPSTPYGFFAYSALPETIFLPVSYQLSNVWIALFKVNRGSWENLFYVGWVSSVFSLFALISFFVFLFKRKKSFDLFNGNHLLRNSFIAATFVLLFSLAVPFAWLPVDWIEHLGLLKQFRSIGRFSIVFFYVVNIAAFAGVYYSISTLKNKTQKALLVLYPLLLLTIDAVSLQACYKPFLNPSRIEQNPNLNINPKDFACFITLPYFHIGSEVYGNYVNCGIDFPAMRFSLQTGIPMTACALSRTSYSQTVQNMGVIWQQYQPLTMPKKITSNKPILLMVMDGCQLLPTEEYWRQRAKKIGMYMNTTLYTLDQKTLQEYGTKMYSKMRDSLAHLNSINLNSAIKDKTIVFNDYNHQKTFQKFKDKCLAIQTNGKIFQLYNGRYPNTKETDFSISFWYFIKDFPFTETRIIMEELDDSGKICSINNTLIKQSFTTYDTLGWVLFDGRLEAKHLNHKVRISLLNPHLKTPVLIDNFLIRPSNSNISLDNGTSFFWNNLYYENSR